MPWVINGNSAYIINQSLESREIELSVIVYVAVVEILKTVYRTVNTVYSKMRELILRAAAGHRIRNEIITRVLTRRICFVEGLTTISMLTSDLETLRSFERVSEPLK